MTTTKPTGLTVPDSDGRPVPIPTACPEWCDGQHLAYAVDNPGLLSAEKIARHIGASGNMFTPDLRNSASGRLMRRDGVTFKWRLREDPLDPFGEIAGNATRWSRSTSTTATAGSVPSRSPCRLHRERRGRSRR